MSPELSIFIPDYNASEYIEACITSIFSETYNNFEVLLIDDGSTVGTGELCDRLAERYPAIRLFHTDNHGIAEARNLGIEQAVGQYIGFVDSDDLVSPIMFESMVKHMSSDVPLVVCRYLAIKRMILPQKPCVCSTEQIRFAALPLGMEILSLCNCA